MGKKGVNKVLQCNLFKFANFILNVITGFGLMLIVGLHFIVPFSPVLFLFDFCFAIGYPALLRFVLKKRWCDCTKEDCLRIKNILFPWLIMEVIVILYYWSEVVLMTDVIMKSNGWK